MQPTLQRGLTLIEVLMATVLLALLAAACLPLIAGSSAALRAVSDQLESPPPLDHAALREIAEALLTDPQRYIGVDDLMAVQRMTFQWPPAAEPGSSAPVPSETADGLPITITLIVKQLQRSAPQGDETSVSPPRAWLVLVCGDVIVIRGVYQPQEQERPT